MDETAIRFALNTMLDEFRQKTESNELTHEALIQILPGFEAEFCRLKADRKSQKPVEILSPVMPQTVGDASIDLVHKLASVLADRSWLSFSVPES